LLYKHKIMLNKPPFDEDTLVGGDHVFKSGYQLCKTVNRTYRPEVFYVENLFHLQQEGNIG
jgi:hypothetical protein